MLVMEPDRYSRQILFPGIGAAGQQRLGASRVAIVGCGALGSFQAGALARAGVGQLLIVDRDPWALELYRHQDGQLTKVGQSTLAAPDVLASQTVGLTFQLLPGEPRPQIQATHPATGRQWVF